MSGTPAKTPNHGLGLTLGGGVGLVFGVAFEAPEMGLIYGAGPGLVVASALSAIANNWQAIKPMQRDDAPRR